MEALTATKPEHDLVDPRPALVSVSAIEAVSPASMQETRPRDIDPQEWERYERSLAEIFEAFGMDLASPGTQDTPRRFLQALYDSTAGYEGDPKLATTFPAETRDRSIRSLVFEGPIAFHSLCEHHGFPFFGVAHIGYVPDERIIGISKLTRLVRVFARRFTVQERLGEQIADGLVDLVDPLGVAVHLEASHLCTRMRGVEEHADTVTTCWRGDFADPDLRREFLSEIHARAR